MKVLHWNLKNKRNVKRKTKKKSSPGGLEPPTFRLTAERANRLRHGDHLRIEGEILKFKSNDSSLRHCPYLVPRPSLLYFLLLRRFFIYCRTAQIYNFSIQDSGKRQICWGKFNRIWLLPGKRDSPKFGHGMQDFFFPICWEIETAQMYVVPCKANYIAAGWRF